MRTPSGSARPRSRRCSTSASRSRSVSCSGSSRAGTSAREYFAGYIVEKSLSVDNLFVFVVIMSAFAVPAEHQQRVLTFGILVALVMRAIFIALGAALISSVLVHVPDLRAAAARHGDPAVPPPRPGPQRRGQRSGAPDATGHTGHRDLRRRPHDHAARRPPGRDAAVHRVDRDRQLGPPVRARLDPGRVRRHRGGVHRLRRQRVRAARACGRCTSWSPGCSTGWSTSPPACR